MTIKSNQNQEFKCINCQRRVFFSDNVGTKNRNHCPFCLWSLHVDLKFSGDRASNCKGVMKPIGLTFKQEGRDKYGKEKQGEIMLVHKCEKCGKISINRIAGDDNSDQIMEIFEKSKTDNVLRDELTKEGINLLESNDEQEIRRQLFGL